MTDGIEPASDKSFKPVTITDEHYEHTLGISGVWLVGSSRDFFSPYDENGIVGIDVSNCCGHFIIGVRK